MYWATELRAKRAPGALSRVTMQGNQSVTLPDNFPHGVIDLSKVVSVRLDASSTRDCPGTAAAAASSSSYC
jgi:hypothetical protein